MPSTGAKPCHNPLHVAVAVIEGADGRILITRRADHLHQGGKWEFPGGKVEQGETIQEALHRELEEELGIRPESMSPLIRIPWCYPDRDVLLDVWRVDSFRGEPRALEGQPMSWVPIQRLTELDFPAANQAIIQALNLPDRLLITPEPGDPESFLEQLEQALVQGEIKLVQFRAKTLGQKAYLQLVPRIGEIVHRHGGRLFLNGMAQWDETLGADGRHLTSDELMSMTYRPCEQVLLSASCHNLLEIEQANRLRLDFIQLSPVERTRTHPDTEPLGWATFEALIDKASMPVYALGGMGIADLPRLRACGAQGIAAIRGLWSVQGS